MLVRMKSTRTVILGLFIVVFATASLALAKKHSHEQLEAEVKETIDRFQEKDSTFKPTLKGLVGYAIFPEIAKGGLSGGIRPSTKPIT